MKSSTESQSPNQCVKRQLEEILKSTKILCELEPFVKKWSISEVLPKLDITPSEEQEEIFQLLRDSKLHSTTDKQEREKVFRKVKEKMTKMGESGLVRLTTSVGSVGDEHDSELRQTLEHLKEIELMDAVTPADIENFQHGLCKPDGLDMGKTSAQEWKNIFLENWLCLSKHDLKRTSSNHTPLPYIVPATSSSTQLSSTSIPLDGHFTTRKGNNPKNISRPNTPEHQRSLWSLKKEKLCSSAKEKMMMTPALRDETLHQDYHHQQRQRLRNCQVDRTTTPAALDKVKPSSNFVRRLQGKLGTPQIRPSSAVPNTGVLGRKLTKRINQG